MSSSWSLKVHPGSSLVSYTNSPTWVLQDVNVTSNGTTSAHHTATCTDTICTAALSLASSQETTSVEVCVDQANKPAFSIDGALATPSTPANLTDPECPGALFTLDTAKQASQVSVQGFSSLGLFYFSVQMTSASDAEGILKPTGGNNNNGGGGKNNRRGRNGQGRGGNNKNNQNTECSATLDPNDHNTSFSFQGDRVALYGTSPHNAFNISIDRRPPTTSATTSLVNANNDNNGQVLFYVAGLDPTQLHTLDINLGKHSNGLGCVQVGVDSEPNAGNIFVDNQADGAQNTTGTATDAGASATAVALTPTATTTVTADHKSLPSSVRLALIIVPILLVLALILALIYILRLRARNARQAKRIPDTESGRFGEKPPPLPQGWEPMSIPAGAPTPSFGGGRSTFTNSYAGDDAASMHSAAGSRFYEPREWMAPEGSGLGRSESISSASETAVGVNAGYGVATGKAREVVDHEGKDVESRAASVHEYSREEDTRSESHLPYAV